LDYLKRREFLRRRGLALWDVLRRAERPGSADSVIKNAAGNNFMKLLATHTGLKAIVFNGGEAKRLFWSHVEKTQPMLARSSLLKVDLPSTSPAPGKHVLPLKEKIAGWKSLTNL
jgi:hypoxanthine-DNA glycosylase